jgi:hypothetical protein
MARARYRRSHKAPSAQLNMFTRGEDLPLFSGTPQIVTVSARVPQPKGKQLSLFPEDNARPVFGQARKDQP